MVSNWAGVTVLLATLSAIAVQEVTSVSYRSAPLAELGGKARRQTSRADNSRTSNGPRVISPCPEVLFNIKNNRNRGRWYGLISVTSDQDVTGVVLDILLNKRADLVGTTFGEVYTDDSIVHTIRNNNKRVKPGQIFPVRFFVKYNSADANPPIVKAIAFNGRQICPLEEAVPPSPATSETPSTNSPPSSQRPATSASLDVENQPGRPQDAPTIPTARPPKYSPSSPNQQETGPVATEIMDTDSNDYEIEWKGIPKKITGRLSDTPELYVINGEFKIKSNASLLILLIARPPNLSTRDHDITDGGTFTVGRGDPEAVGSPGEENLSDPLPEHLDDPSTKAHDSKEFDGPTTSESTVPQVPDPQHNEESGEAVEEEPPFISNFDDSTVPSGVHEEQTTTAAPSTPAPATTTTARIPSEAAGPGIESGRSEGPTQWASPCPGVLAYLPNSPGSDTWYGSLDLTAKEDLLGIRLNVELDKPSRNLGAWLGEVTSKDNIHYTIWNSTTEIQAGEITNVRFFVKYDREEVDPPRIRTIRLNGRQICPTRKVMATTVLPFEDVTNGDEPNPLTQRINALAPTDGPTPKPGEVAPSSTTDKTASEGGASAFPDEQNSFHSTSTAAPETVETTTDIFLGGRIDYDTSVDTPDEEADKPAGAQYGERHPPISPATATTTERGIPEEDDMTCGRTEVEQTPMTTYEQRTVKGQWPWHAAIYQFRGDDRYYICGGSLIGERTILTAARCLSDGRPVDLDSLVVYIGMQTLHRWDNGVQYKEVQDVHINPDYNSTNLNGNLAVLILSSPVELSAYVKPVCLWDGKEEEPSDIRGEEGVVAGWGYDKYGLLSEDLIISKMPVLYQRACLWNYPELFQFLSESIYCAGYRSETTVCNGESGDGMFFPSAVHQGAAGRGSSPTWTIRGVASFALSLNNGIECSAKNYVVFTDVAKYHNWIEKYR